MPANTCIATVVTSAFERSRPIGSSLGSDNPPQLWLESSSENFPNTTKIHLGPSLTKCQRDVKYSLVLMVALHVFICSSVHFEHTHCMDGVPT